MKYTVPPETSIALPGTLTTPLEAGDRAILSRRMMCCVLPSMGNQRSSCQWIVACVQITINTLKYSAMKQIFALYSIVPPGPGADLQQLGSESVELHSEVFRACLVKPACGRMPLSRNEQLASRKR